MKFLSRIGSLHKSISCHSNTLSIGQVPRMSMLNVVRHMETSCRIYVGGLPWAFRDCDLRKAFAGNGEVVDAKVMMDPETGLSRGFGYVSFSNPEAAYFAVLYHKELNGRTLTINYANEKPRRFGGRGSYRQNGGGYGGNFVDGGKRGNYGGIRGGFDGNDGSYRRFRGIYGGNNGDEYDDIEGG